MSGKLQISRRRRASRWRSGVVDRREEFTDSGREVHPLRLARRQCSELRWIRHAARRGIRLASRSVCVTHTHLTADPGSTDIDSVAGPAVT
jgi:hypothetical protein